MTVSRDDGWWAESLVTSKNRLHVRHARDGCLGSTTNHRLNYRNNDDEGLGTQVTQRKGLEMQPEEPCMFFFTFFFAYTNVYLQINTCKLYLCHSTTVFPNRRDDDIDERQA